MVAYIFAYWSNERLENKSKVNIFLKTRALGYGPSNFLEGINGIIMTRKYIFPLLQSFYYYYFYYDYYHLYWI